MKKSITVVTGSRADFGMLKGLLRLLQNSAELDLNLIVTGSHLSQMHGFTSNEIKESGFLEFQTIELNLSLMSEDKAGFVVSEVVAKFSEHLSRHQPSIVILLGDRYEIFGVAIACATQGIPIGHIHGGEVTQGSRDEIYRHAITKLSSVHFVANEEFSRRVLQLGENPGNVHVVGGLGVDSISEVELFSKSEMEKCLGFCISDNLAIVTFHPDTNNPAETAKQVETLLGALVQLPEVQFVITGANADYQGDEVNSKLRDAATMHSNLFFTFSLGQRGYFSMLSLAKVVVGNSSSGLLEAPTFGLATVNIGARQNGRPRANSIIDVSCSESSIKQGILTALSEEFQILSATAENPYGEPGASIKILKTLEKLNFNSLLPKRFFDNVIGEI